MRGGKGIDYDRSMQDERTILLQRVGLVRYGRKCRVDSAADYRRFSCESRLEGIVRRSTYLIFGRPINEGDNTPA